MCFSSYSLQTKGDQPTWFRQHIHLSDKIQDPILLLKPPVHAWDKTNHQTCCYTVPLDCITVQASYPRLLCTLMVLYRITLDTYYLCMYYNIQFDMCMTFMILFLFRTLQTIQDWHMFLLLGVLLLIDANFLIIVTAVPQAILRAELEETVLTVRHTQCYSCG